MKKYLFKKLCWNSINTPRVCSIWTQVAWIPPSSLQLRMMEAPLQGEQPLGNQPGATVPSWEEQTTRISHLPQSCVLEAKFQASEAKKWGAHYLLSLSPHFQKRDSTSSMAHEKSGSLIPLTPANSVSSVQFSHSVMSDSLWPHGLQHIRPPCPSPTPRTYSNSCPSSRSCHSTISSSVIPFSFCLQSFPASGSFQMGQFFTSGGQSIGVSGSASVPPMNI